MVAVTCIEPLAQPRKMLLKFGLLHIGKTTPWNIIQIIFNYLLDCVVYTLIILNLRNAIRIRDRKNAYWMACLLIPMTTFSAKKASLIINRSSLMALFEFLKSDTFNPSNEKLNRHIRLIYRSSKVVLKYFSGVVLGEMLICGVLPFIVEVKLMMPPPFYMGKFDVAYKILQAFCIGYMGSTLVILDVLYITLLGLGVAQINILKERLIDVSKDCKARSEVRKNGIMDVRSTKQVLNECIILYETIYQYLQNLNVLLALPLSIQYISGCFTVSNMLLQVRNSNELHANTIGTVISYCGIILGEMTAFHWLSNEIIYKSDQITTSCYFSNWYQLNTSSRKSLILIMERAKRPLDIRLYKYILLNLDSLAAIFRWSYSVFALMRAGP